MRVPPSGEMKSMDQESRLGILGRDTDPVAVLSRP
jgi:hypothetical protein